MISGQFICQFLSFFLDSSDRNSACCKDCMFERKGKVCQEPMNATCKGRSYCTGEASVVFIFIF